MNDFTNVIDNITYLIVKFLMWTSMFQIQIDSSWDTHHLFQLVSTFVILAEPNMDSGGEENETEFRKSVSTESLNSSGPLEDASTPSDENKCSICK